MRKNGIKYIVINFVYYDIRKKLNPRIIYKQISHCTCLIFVGFQFCVKMV